MEFYFIATYNVPGVKRRANITMQAIANDIKSAKAQTIAKIQREFDGAHNIELTPIDNGE